MIEHRHIPSVSHARNGGSTGFQNSLMSRKFYAVWR